MVKINSQHICIVLHRLMRTICLPLFLALFPATINARTPEKVLEQNKGIVTVRVQDKDKQHVASGRGFVLDRSGVIATNCPLIAKWLEQAHNRLKVETEDRLILPVAELISSRCENNLALIKIHSEELSAVTVSRGYEINLGNQVFLITENPGHPAAVSDITIQGAIARGRLYRVSRQVPPELSGSPLFNEKGEVVGAAVISPGKGKPGSAFASLSPILKQLDTYRKTVRSEKDFSVPRTGKKEPETADDLIAQAFTYSRQGQYLMAVDAYTKALEKGPQSASLYNKLGVAHLISGDYAAAHEAFEKAWSLAPQDPVTYFNLGITNTLMGKKTTAYEYYNVLKTLDTERAKSLKELID